MQKIIFAWPKSKNERDKGWLGEDVYEYIKVWEVNELIDQKGKLWKKQS